MSGPRGGLGLELFALSGEAEPEERSGDLQPLGAASSPGTSAPVDVAQRSI